MEPLAGQLRLDLFNKRKEVFDYANVEHVTRWLIEDHRCTEQVRPYVLGLFAEFDAAEAFERSKALPRVNGVHCVPGWCLQDAIDYFQIYSHEIDYHVVWVRAWSAAQGLAKDDVLRVTEWDYGKKEPIYGRREQMAL